MFAITNILVKFVLNYKHLSSRKNTLLPTNARLLVALGENLTLARKRRQLTAEQVAERADISRTTLWLIEKGASGVSMSAYLQVLFVLGMEKDILKLAGDDHLGRKLQDAKLLSKKDKPEKN
jgi:transcriptional regulator with XRE-family HTH domain